MPNIYYSEVEQRLKCCQNCLRCSSSTVTSVSCYYCNAYKKFINPIGCCPLYIPKEGYKEEA